MTHLFYRPLVLMSLAALLLQGCSSEQTEKQTPAELPVVPVQAVVAETSSPARQVEVMGTVQAKDSASIAARVSGNITEMPVDLGSRVSKGDLLLKISAGEISAKLLQAQAQLEQANRNLERERALLKKNASTQVTVRTMEESRRIAEAAYNEARSMLSYATIEAPFDGVVTQKMASIGDLATPGKTLLELESESKLQIIADIPETLVLALSYGDKLPVTIPAAGLSLTGTVSEIAPRADPASRTAPVKLTLEADESIRSGQFARLALPGTRGEAILLPQSAVLPYGQMDRVYVVSDGKAHLRLIKIGLSQDGMVEILAGVKAGDLVVVQGNEQVQDGQPVSLQ